MKLMTACVWIACAGAALAQSDARGHWSGNIDGPQGPLAVELDLDKAGSGWVGSISIPAQGAMGVPLDPVAFTGGKLSFSIKGPAAGSPAFSGTLSADGKTLDGTISGGPQSFPVKLTRTGEPKVELQKASPPVAAEFLGTWEGVIDAGQPLRIALTIKNGKAGAEATLVSLDQGNAAMEASSVIQTGTKISIEVKVVSGGFEGEINKEGTQISGNWSQLGNGTVLVLKKAK